MKCEIKSSSKKILLTITSMKWKMTEQVYDILFVIFSYAILGSSYSFHFELRIDFTQNFNLIKGYEDIFSKNWTFLSN